MSSMIESLIFVIIVDHSLTLPHSIQKIQLVLVSFHNLEVEASVATEGDSRRFLPSNPLSL